MTVQLPTPGEEPWGEELNDAILSIDTDVTALESQTAGLTSDVSALNSRVDALESGGGGTGGNGGTGGTGTPAVSRMVPLIIFNGESNSGGYAQNELATAGELAPRPQVKIFDNVGLGSFLDLDIGGNNLVDHAGLPTNATHGWELGLANSVVAGEWWNDTVYLIKTGQGGSMISQWNSGGAYYTKFEQRVRAGLAIMRGMGLVPVIYFWYTIGINDAIAGTPEASWKTSVEEFFVRVRKELGYVPIIYSHAMAASSGVNFNDSIDAMAASDNMVIPVVATGTTTRDANHWDYTGMKVMAGRMVAASKNFGQQEGYNHRRIDQLGAGSVVVAPPDVPTLVRTPATLTFTEGGSGGQFTVALSKQPSATTVVTVAISGGNAQVSTPSLSFATTNWSVPQTVTVTSPNDGAASGNRTATVTLSSAGVTGPATVGCTITDAGVGPSAPLNTALPAISGTATTGNSLTCSTGSWSGSPSSYAYQWKRNNTNIAGQTTNSHTVVTADEGTTLTCAVTATNGQGSTTSTSAGMSVGGAVGNWVAYAWQDLTSASMDGSNYLICNGGSSSGANAVGSIDNAGSWEIAIEWQSASAVGAVVSMVDDGAGSDFSWGPSQQFLSSVYTTGGAFYVGVDGNTAPTNVGWSPTFPCYIKMAKSGNDVVYSTADTINGPWTTRYTHVGRLTGKTLIYPRALFATPSAGQKIKFWYNANLTAPVAAPVNATLPAISGTVNQGDTLTCSTGVWSGSPSGYAYQWKRDGANIAGATTNSHVVVAADNTTTLTCAVTATNAIGSTTATSAGKLIAVTSITPFTWKDFAGSSQDGNGYLVFNGGSPAGANAVEVLDNTQSWTVYMEFSGSGDPQAAPIIFDSATSLDFSWASQTQPSSFYHTGTGVGHVATTGSAAATNIPGWSVTFPVTVKAEKRGNDLVYSSSTDGTNWTERYVHAGALAGLSQIFVRIVHAAPSASSKVKISRDAAAAGPSAPINVTLPSIGGGVTAGSVLTCAPGGWNGNPAPTYTYQWKHRGGTNISGETANTHTVVVADEGTTLTCTVTATNTQGNASATTNGFGIPVPGSTPVPVTWGNFESTDSSGAGTVRNTTGGTGGGRTVETFDVSQPFEVEVEYSSVGLTNGVVVYIDDHTTTTNYSWTSGNDFLVGSYQYNSAHQSCTVGGSAIPTTETTLGMPCTIKMAKSGDDVIFTKKTTGGYGSVFHTQAGVLAGKTTVCIKALFAVPSVNQEIKVNLWH